jgi:ankyrin repeat protein
MMFAALGLSVGAGPAWAEAPAGEAPAEAAADTAAWAGPIEAEVELVFGDDGNTAAEGTSILAEADGGAIGIELPLGVGNWGAQTMLTLPADAGMATGPDQYLEFELFIEAEKPSPWLIQVDERAGETPIRGRFILPAAEIGAWQTITVNLLRNEVSGDPRRGSKIPPDGTPLTQLGIKIDPRIQAGVQAVRVRNVRLYRQDKLANAPADAADEAGQTALHRAAMAGDSAKALELLERGADVNGRNKYLYTPLALAVISHDVETVRVLIENGADVGAQRQLGFTPLYDAAADGLIEVMTLLMDAGADPRQKTKYGFEPLFTAVHHGHIDAAELLINDPRVDVNGLIAGFIPLHVAAQGDEEGPHREMYGRLIELGADVDLCSAAGAGDIDRMKAILEENPSAAKDFTILGGWTPLHDAVRNVRVEAVELLLANGADPNAVSGEIDYKTSPLHWISVNVLLDDPDAKLATLKLMVDAGADLNPVDQYGLTPLDRVKHDQCRELIDAMLELGALTGKQIKAQAATEAETDPPADADGE